METETGLRKITLGDLLDETVAKFGDHDALVYVDRDFCRGKISRYKIPRYVHFVTDYPMTASGKIQKYKLTEMAETIWPDRR